ERQYEAIVETISEEEKEGCGQEEIVIPLSGEHVEPVLQVGEFNAPDQATKVKHVVEGRGRCRGFREGPSRRAGKAVPKTGGENGGQHRYYENVTELLRPGCDSPTKACNKRQHTSIEKNIQLKKN